MNTARQNVYHLPPLPKKSLYAPLPQYVDLILYAYSPLLVPKPPDWGETTKIGRQYTPVDSMAMWVTSRLFSQSERANKPTVVVKNQAQKTVVFLKKQPSILEGGHFLFDIPKRVGRMFRRL